MSVTLTPKQSCAEFSDCLLVPSGQPSQAQGDQGIVVVDIGRTKDDPACTLLNSLQLL